jgi:hypothetical protein
MSLDYEEDDGFDFEAPSDYGAGGAFLDAGDDGTYHVEVTEVERDPKSAKGDLIANAAFKVTFLVLAGTNPKGVAKTGNFILFNPDFSKGEKSVEFARKRIGRFFVSVGLKNENDPTRDAQGNPIKTRVSLPAAVGRQFIVTMATSEYNGKRNLQLNFADMFHVDDPEKSGVPKDAKAIANYPAQFRRKPESFASGKAAHAQAQVSKPANGSASGGGLPKQATQAAQAATVTADDL